MLDIKTGEQQRRVSSKTECVSGWEPWVTIRTHHLCSSSDLKPRACFVKGLHPLASPSVRAIPGRGSQTPLCHLQPLSTGMASQVPSCSCSGKCTSQAFLRFLSQVPLALAFSEHGGRWRQHPSWTAILKPYCGLGLILTPILSPVSIRKYLVWFWKSTQANSFSESILTEVQHKCTQHKRLHLLNINYLFKLILFMFASPEQIAH